MLYQQYSEENCIIKYYGTSLTNINETNNKIRFFLFPVE